MEKMITILSKCFHEFGSFLVCSKTENLYQRLLRYINEAHRDGVMGDGRYAVAMAKAEKLHRFLIICGKPKISVSKFTTDLVLQYRQFIYDEYTYVPLYPNLYSRTSGHRPPRKRMRNTTVVHDLKLLQAFFAELENTNEIRRSPFRNISMEKRRILMHVMYDAPIYLRAEEMRRVMETKVPKNLQLAKDIFVLNCTIGCRISDLLRLTPDKVAISDEGIPYVHYIPHKTMWYQTLNREVTTPLIEPALEIIHRTQLRFFVKNQNYFKQCYNKLLRQLLAYCGITRRVSIYCPETDDNVYKPICEIATSKLARKTHIDMLCKVQINFYAAGLHRDGSEAVFRYTHLELSDRYRLLQIAFGDR